MSANRVSIHIVVIHRNGENVGCRKAVPQGFGPHGGDGNGPGGGDSPGGDEGRNERGRKSKKEKKSKKKSSRRRRRRDPSSSPSSSTSSSSSSSSSSSRMDKKSRKKLLRRMAEAVAEQNDLAREYEDVIWRRIVGLDADEPMVERLREIIAARFARREHQLRELETRLVETVASTGRSSSARSSTRSLLYGDSLRPGRLPSVNTLRSRLTPAGDEHPAFAREHPRGDLPGLLVLLAVVMILRMYLMMM